MSKLRAEFIGYQMSFDPSEPAEPLFNIIGPHEFSKSTVGKETLIRLGIPVPDFPPVHEWALSRLL